MTNWRLTLCAAGAILAAPAMAQDVPVTRNANFTFNGQDLTISRANQVDAALVAQFSRVTEGCERPCLAPMIAAEGVETLAEVDVIDFLSGPVAGGQGLLIDARLPTERSLGFIAASVNIPAATVTEDNPYRNEILKALGAREFDGALNFTDAMLLVVFDGGPSTSEAQSMITNLIDAGYPTDKIAYYRGGMQVWTTLGLSAETAQ